MRLLSWIAKATSVHGYKPKGRCGDSRHHGRSHGEAGTGRDDASCAGENGTGISTAMMASVIMACFALDNCSTLQKPEGAHLVGAMAGRGLCGLGGGGGTGGGSLLGRHVVDGWCVCGGE